MKTIYKAITKCYLAILALAAVCAFFLVKPLEGTRFHPGKGQTADSLKSYLPTSGLVLNIKADMLAREIDAMTDGPLKTGWNDIKAKNGFTIYSAADSLNEVFKSIVNPNNIIESISPGEGFVFKDGKKPSLEIPESEYDGCVKAPAWIVMYLIEQGQFNDYAEDTIEK